MKKMIKLMTTLMLCAAFQSIWAVPAQRTVTLAEGAAVQVRLSNGLTTDTNKAGDRFDAILDEDLVSNGQLVAPRGSLVSGELVESQKSGDVKGKARMSLTLRSITVNGERYPLKTNNIVVEAQGSKSKDAKVIGGGAGIGALLGAIIGGGKGAIIGAAVGAGAGTGAVLVTDGKEVEFESEQQFRFVTEQATRMPVVSDRTPGSYSSSSGGNSTYSSGSNSGYDRSGDSRYARPDDSAFDSSNDSRFDQTSYTAKARDLQQAAERLSRTAEEQLQRAFDRSSSRSGSTSSVDQRELELYFALSNFSNSARLFSQIAAKADGSQLEPAVDALNTQVSDINQLIGRAPNANLRSDWDEVKHEVEHISEMYSDDRFISTRDSNSRNTSYSSSGSLRWSGSVDGADYVLVRGDRVVVQHLEAEQVRNATFDLSDPLPNRELNLELNQLQGRGQVRLVERPSQSNNYTAVVLIEDTRPGRDFYSFELRWR